MPASPGFRADPGPAFSAAHRGGTGPPLVAIHGIADTWRTWELVLPALERFHDVLAVTLPGHAGGPLIDRPVDSALLADGVEWAMDEAGIADAHLVGNSLGGFVALTLAARGRARSVVALAPAGGWTPGDPAFVDMLRMQQRLIRSTVAGAPFADEIVASREGARRATELITVRFEHIPRSLIAHQIRGVAACAGGEALIECAIESG